MLKLQARFWYPLETVETHMLNFWYHRRNSSENKTPQSRGDRLIVTSSLN
jgi:hypothetical protein